MSEDSDSEEEEEDDDDEESAAVPLATQSVLQPDYASLASLCFAFHREKFVGMDPLRPSCVFIIVCPSVAETIGRALFAERHLSIENSAVTGYRGPLSLQPGLRKARRKRY